MVSAGACGDRRKARTKTVATRKLLMEPRALTTDEAAGDDAAEDYSRGNDKDGSEIDAAEDDFASGSTTDCDFGYAEDSRELYGDSEQVNR